MPTPNKKTNPGPTPGQDLPIHPDDVAEWLELQRDSAAQVGPDASTFLEVLILDWKQDTNGNS